MSLKIPVTVAYGDGIGPEIMGACLKLMEAAGAALQLEPIEVGEQVYKRGFHSGIEPSAWETLRRNRFFYKAPITTPQGGGYKSLNVTIRKTLGLFANVRPIHSFHPFVSTHFPNMDVVIIRENEEDLYAGIEHRQTAEVYQCLKLITRPGSEKVIQYAFEYARRNNRHKITCFTKDNIMKMTDGLFRKVFHEMAALYPDIESDHMIIDIGTARLADSPENFDVIVVPNLYGDILSDVAAQIAGSVGLGASANVGERVAMYEAIHGSAPDIAGKGIANPSGLLLAGILMLVRLRQTEAAEVLHNAWLCTLEEGIHTGDIYTEGQSKQRVGTADFTQAILERLGKRPQSLKPVVYQVKNTANLVEVPSITPAKMPKKALVGVDVFLDWHPLNRDPNELGALLLRYANSAELQLNMISNRGLVVYPGGLPETFCTDHWRCRFLHPQDQPIQHQQILELLGRIQAAGLDFIKTENLYTFDGQPGFSMGQGEN
jgi:isocitrate dehydrogenase